MNPPFTRDSLRHDQFSRSDELAIKQKEKDILKGHASSEAVHLSGSSTLFTALGEHLLNRNDATLALVLPTVIPTAPSGAGLRKFLAKRFHIDTVVSSHDPERIFFSENTSIGEILLVCRRWSGNAPKPPTKIINLARNPSTPIQALDMATRIEQSTSSTTPGSSGFTVQYILPNRIESGDWYAVNFLSPFLVEAYWTLTEDGDKPFPVQALGEIAKVGPEGRRIRDTYTHSDMPSVSGRRALWHHKTDVTQSMRASTDVYIEPKPTQRHLADNYWEQRSRLLLPQRLRLNTARVAAVVVDEPAVGSRWEPCRPHDQDASTIESLGIYLNSSIGMLALFGGRDNRIPSYPSFSIDSLRKVPVPDFATVGRDARDSLSTGFKRFRDDALLSFPQMNDDPVRKQIDDAVTHALDLDPEWVARIRRSLSEEPSVTNQRYGLS